MSHHTAARTATRPYCPCFHTLRTHQECLQRAADLFALGHSLLDQYTPSSGETTWSRARLRPMSLLAEARPVVLSSSRLAVESVASCLRSTKASICNCATQQSERFGICPSAPLVPCLCSVFDTLFAVHNIIRTLLYSSFSSLWQVSGFQPRAVNSGCSSAICCSREMGGYTAPSEGVVLELLVHLWILSVGRPWVFPASSSSLWVSGGDFMWMSWLW